MAERSLVRRERGVSHVETDSERAIAHWREIQRLKLERHVAELDVLGYTIVPPEVASPERFAWLKRCTSRASWRKVADFA